MKLINFTCDIINVSINTKKTTNALVVKSVDTKDLKSLPIRECRFESGRGHQKFNSIFSQASDRIIYIKKI